MRPSESRCGHRYPDGTWCTLTDHSAPGLAETHGLVEDEGEPHTKANAWEEGWIAAVTSLIPEGLSPIERLGFVVIDHPPVDNPYGDE